MLTRNGYVTDYSDQVKRDLTVRPVENGIGIPSPSFKVWRRVAEKAKATVVLPNPHGSERTPPPVSAKALAPESKASGCRVAARRDPLKLMLGAQT